MILFFDILPVDALSCSKSVSKDLSTVASHVKVAYEVIDKSEVKELNVGEEKTKYTVPNFDFEISIYNITDDIYVEVKNDVDGRNRTVYFKDTDNGVYTFTNSDFGQVYNYTFDIKSTNDGCYGQKIRTTKLVKPKYNAYSEFTYCQNSANFYCQKFTTKDLKLGSTYEFLQKITVNNEKNKPVEEEETSITQLVKQDWKIYLGLFAIVIILASTIIVIMKKRKKAKEWKL